MNILAFKGKSLVSRAIRWQTRSEYSHIAIELDGGEIVEAWHRGGVMLHSNRASLLSVHDQGTEIDVFHVPISRAKATAASVWLKNQVGAGYDFRSIFRFLSRRPAASNDRWFCSELAAKALEIVGTELQRSPAHHLSPRDVVMSPRIEFTHGFLLCPVLLSAEIK